MGIRTGTEYLKGLQDGREVWFRGERVADVTAHPGLRRGAQTLAGFLDRQHEETYRDIVTYTDVDGERCETSYLIPKSKDDVKRRGKAFYEWAKWSNGMFGRTPDYKNTSVMAFAAARGFLDADRGFADNMVRFYDSIRKGDRVLTHTLVNPTFSHEMAAKGQYSDKVALHVVKETDAGIVVRGARLLATLGPHADEIEVFPASVMRANEDNHPFAFAFALPVATDGLKLICRDSYDEEKSHFDAPISSRYEEMDAVVVFDDVLVPWERVFMYSDPARCNQAFGATNALVHMMHQVACGKLAKTEFIVGLLCAMAKATGKDKDTGVKNLIAEAMWAAESVRAFVFSAEEQAHEDQWGVHVPLRRPLDAQRNLYPRTWPRLVELVQMLGSSSLMATPGEADFSNGITPYVEQYFQVENLPSRDRVALFRLAQDIAVSGFGARQTLYERFFFGPPQILGSVFFDLYNRDEMMDRVDALLKN
ncbi:MAG: 4-hydroxyphenylacetate 3-monooxygenase, oxygenase component [Beijerinckiaceae bacterium]